MKIFISYSRDGAADFAKHIHRYLRDKGHAVFIDVNNIRIGDPWADSIEKNISDCDIFVVILTPDSLMSNHVEREVLQAQRENKIIVPCINEDVEYSELKWGLEKVQGIEFSDEYQLKPKLYSKIRNYTNKENEKPSSILQQNTIQYPNISEDVDALYEKGLALSNQAKYQEAIECYDKALRIDPNYVDALNDKGNALNNLGKYYEAIKYLDKALTIDPNYTLAQDIKKLALDRLSKETSYHDPRSKGTMPKGWKPSSRYSDTSLYSEDIGALNAKDISLSNQGKYQEAIEYYDKALRLDPNDKDALYNKGLALYYQGKYQEAIEYYDKALAVDPNSKHVLNGKGLVLNDLGKYQEARVL